MGSFAGYFALFLVLYMVWSRATTVEYPVHTAGGVLITGCSSGIGLHAAIALASSTNFTVFAGVRKQADADKVKLAHASLHPIIIDVADTESIRRALAAVNAELDQQQKPLVGLVNNAGVSVRSLMETSDLQATRKVFDVNVFGLLELTQAVLPQLRESKGRIVHVGSLAGVATRPQSGVYSASKHAVEAFSDAMRRELEFAQVSVSLVQPGTIKSEMTKVSKAENHDSFQNLDDAQRKAYTPIIEKQQKSTIKAYTNHRDPSTSSEAILHALTSNQPKARYAVAGYNNLPAWFIQWLVPLVNGRTLDYIMKML
eukprot:m.16467 g.16467  ORF g.16467 m.16467 type:complete len:314 (-) comp11051_c0_seq1:151-1092(-)